MPRGGAKDHEAGSALGLLECGSLARGLEAADAAWKAAPVRPLWVRAIEPGVLLLAFTGTVDAVREAVRAGRAVLAEALRAELLLPGPHPQLLRALRSTAIPEAGCRALGLLECATVAATLRAADAAVKHAEVELFHLRVSGGMGGRGLVCLAGTEADVESAVHTGAELAERQQALVRASIITEPAGGLLAAAARI
ncbi:MAG: propanediol utilization: polyhedral bodies pduT [Planctomycetota bacterium]|nr:MAG: propanediol utilization: polyhedral bodies pduT [Planctomycetota bacterium]